jgi:hypothetical protein
MTQCAGGGARVLPSPPLSSGRAQPGGFRVIEKCIENWHRFIRGQYPGGLDELLADDVVFYSPVVFTPQKGKDVTKLYLAAAGNTFGGDGAGAASKPAEGKSAFHYTKEVMAGHHAFLEFETEMGGKHVNGVDIISCNDRGQIVEFRVMIRPLQAIQLVHAQMARMLERMKGGV